MHHILINRAQGKFPLSMATSLAYESLLNIHDEVRHPKPPIFNYRCMWVNVQTLLRNIINACEDKGPILARYDDLVETLLEEMEFINSFSFNEAKGLKTRYYFSEYKDFTKTYKEANLKGFDKDKLTANQFASAITHEQVMKRLLRKVNQEGKPNHLQTVMVFENKLTFKENDKALILTHFPYDLLSHYNFRHLDLIESHTGALKKRIDWFTKLRDGKYHPNIPFSEPMLQIFGDDVLFGPINIKYRNDVLAVAKDRNWHQLTSTEKMKSDLKHHSKLDFDYSPFFERKLSL